MIPHLPHDVIHGLLLLAIVAVLIDRWQYGRRHDRLRADVDNLGGWAELAQDWMTDADRHLPARGEPTAPLEAVIDGDLRRVLDETPRPTPRPRGRHAARE